MRLFKVNMEMTVARSDVPVPSGIPTALIRGVGAATALFLAYEFVERLFLGGASPERLHNLHILRGLSASALAAGATAWSLRGRPPAFAPRASLPEASAFDDRAAWLVELRWLALLGTLIALFLGRHVFELVPAATTPFLWAGVAALLVSNVLYLRLSRGRTRMETQVTLQISTDLFILAGMLSLSGGLANPAACLVAFHVLLAAIVLDRRHAAWVVLGASLLLFGLAVLGWLGLLPPSGFQPTGSASPGLEPWPKLVGLVLLLWGTWFFSTALTDRLRRSGHEILAALFDRLSDGFAVADAQGRLVYANAVAARILGKPADSLEGRLVCEALCGPSGALPLHGSAGPCPLLAAKGPHVATVEPRELRLHGFGERRRLILMEDISAELEFKRRKEDWKNMIDHDMRTPLTMIMGSLAVLEDDASLKPGDRSLLSIALRGCRRMLALLDLELDVAKLTAGLMPVRARGVDLEALARQCAEEAKAAASRSGVSVVVDAAKGVKAWADEDLLHRILLNLLDNAVKFMPEGGEVSVSVSHPSEDGVRVLVKDTGVGIAPEDLPKVFDRYYQAQARREGRSRGTGLGLTFCLEAMKAMGGTISLTSKPGEGSAFALTLPLVSHAGAEPPA